MTISGSTLTRDTEFDGNIAIYVVAAMIAVLFAGSTVLTPLYVIYKQQFGFSQIMLTLIYAVYVVGNLAALLMFGGVSDRVGRRPAALAAMAIAFVSGLAFLAAQNVALLDIARILSGLGIGIGAGTGTAWIAELIAEDDKARVSMIATSTNFLGLGAGALVSGLLAQYAPWPLRLPFAVYLLALAVITLLVWRTRETVQDRTGLAEVSMRLQLSVPSEIRAQFVAPAVAGFGTMALVGFYAALAPSILAQQLHETSNAVAGLLFFELAIVVAGTIRVTMGLSSRTAMLTALALMIPSVALVVAAQVMGSILVMVVATACCGVAAGLGYRGSLQVVNQIAPDAQRAAVVSMYFVCCFCGNALPVIGIGVLSTFFGPITASLAFSAMIAVFALVALAFGVKYAR